MQFASDVPVKSDKTATISEGYVLTDATERGWLDDIL